MYLSLGWIIFVRHLPLRVGNRRGRQGSSDEWVALLVACVLMQYPVIWYAAASARRANSRGMGYS